MNVNEGRKALDNMENPAHIERIFFTFTFMELFGITLTDGVGYLASLLLMISFALKNVRSLRIVNSFGCIAFIIYGFMLSTSWPIIITNGFIVAMNSYYLFFKKQN